MILTKAATVLSQSSRRRRARALPVKLDVGKDEDIEAAVQKTLDTFGRIDILMNNAAILVPGTTRTVQPRHIDLIYRINLRAPIMLAKLLSEPMVARGRGHVVFMSSLSGKAATALERLGVEIHVGTIVTELDAESITCPVRIVWGTADKILPWPTAAARYRNDWLPNADWVELDGVGHCPQLDVPLEARQLILGFTSG